MGNTPAYSDSPPVGGLNSGASAIARAEKEKSLRAEKKRPKHDLSGASNAELLEQMRARLARQLAGQAEPGKPAVQVVEVEEADIQLYLATASRILELQESVRKDSEKLKYPPKGVLPETVKTWQDGILDRQRILEAEINELRPLVVELGKRPEFIELVEVRTHQREQAEKMKKAMAAMASPNGTAVAGLVSDALNGHLAKAVSKPDGDEGFIWFSGGAERTIVCAVPEDPVISGAFDVLVDLVVAFKARSEERRDRSLEEVKKYLISTKRSAPHVRDSELDLLKADEATAHNLVDFFGGRGSRTFLAMRNDRRTDRRGEPEFLGEAEIKRDPAKADGYISQRVSQENGAHLLYGYFKKGQPWTENGPIKFTAVKKVGNDGKEFYDFPGLRSNLLMSAIIARVKADQESKAKRDAADNLRDISKIQNPITWAELRSGVEEGTTPVSYTEDLERGRKLHLTYHLEGDGKGKFRVVTPIADTFQKAEWLKRFTEWRSVSEMDTDKDLRKVRGKNADFERSWVLATMAERHGATAITRENLGVLMDLEKGEDGVYSLESSWFNRETRRWSPLGYVLKRSGGAITVLDSVPGLSERTIRDEGDGPHELVSLPPRVRAVFRNAYAYMLGLSGKEGQEMVPSHLKPAQREDEAPAGDNGSDRDEE